MFDVTVGGDDLEAMDYQAEANNERAEAAESRFDRLAERAPDADERG